MHYRATIKNKIKELLLNKTLVGTEIFTNKDVPHNHNGIPYINLYARSESVEILDKAPRSYKRAFTFQIGAIVKETEAQSVEQQLDQVSEEIENVLLSDEFFDQTIEDLIFKSSEYELDTSSDIEIGQVVMEFDAIYHTEAPYINPSDDFSGSDSNWKIKNNLETPDQAVDQINVEV